MDKTFQQQTTQQQQQFSVLEQTQQCAVATKCEGDEKKKCVTMMNNNINDKNTTTTTTTTTTTMSSDDNVVQQQSSSAVIEYNPLALQKQQQQQKETDVENVPPTTVVSATFSGFEGPEKKLEIDFKRVDGTSGEVQYASYPLKPSTRKCGLRALSRQQLDTICSLVSCTILSSTSNEFFDSYVLSESSLFVYPQKLLMKTCGTTTLLLCLETVIQYAAEIGLKVEALFYSRQKFIFPEKQKAPHTSFDHEVAHLSDVFPNGQSYCLGDRSSEHWFLYHVDLSHGKLAAERKDRNIEIMMEKLDGDIMQMFHQSTYATVASAAAAIAKCDPSLFVRRAASKSASRDLGVVAAVARLNTGVMRALAQSKTMFDIVVVEPTTTAATDPAIDSNNNNNVNDNNNAAAPVAAAAVVEMFEDDDVWRDGVPADIADAIERGDTVCAARCAIRRLLPLDELFPGVVIDDHVFSPCGYSVNALCGPTYVTMHVTPELTHSFVSFETNCSLIDAHSSMAFVTRRLRPGRASLSVLADIYAMPAIALRRAAPLVLPAYRQRARTHYELYADDGSMPFDVMYSCFTRVPSAMNHMSAMAAV